MSLMDKLNVDMKEAMKAKDKDALAVIRMLKASVQNVTIEVGRNLTQEEELTILARELKQRKESIHEFKKAERYDLVEKTVQELHVVERYLPKQLAKEEIIAVVQEVARQVDAKGMSDFGKVMSSAMTRLKGQADGNVVNVLVKEVLQQLG